MKRCAGLGGTKATRAAPEGKGRAFENEERSSYEECLEMVELLEPVLYFSRDAVELQEEICQVGRHAVARRQLIEALDLALYGLHLIRQFVSPSSLPGGRLLSLLPTIPLLPWLAFAPSLRANHHLMFRFLAHSRMPLPAVSCPLLPRFKREGYRSFELN